MAGCCSTAVKSSTNRPPTCGLMASFSSVPARPKTTPLSAETAKWLDQKCTRRSANGRIGQRGALRACQHLCAVMGLIGLANGIERYLSPRRLLMPRASFAALVARRHIGGKDLIGGCERRIDGQRHGALDLRRQPAARVTGSGRQIAGSRAETKAQDGYFGLHHEMITVQPPKRLRRGSQKW